MTCDDCRRTFDLKIFASLSNFGCGASLVAPKILKIFDAQNPRPTPDHQMTIKGHRDTLQKTSYNSPNKQKEPRRQETTMIQIAINILWLLIGAVVLCGVIWLVLYGLKEIAGVPIPPRVEQGVWFIVLLLIIIAALGLLATGSIHGPTMSLR